MYLSENLFSVIVIVLLLFARNIRPNWEDLALWVTNLILECVLCIPSSPSCKTLLLSIRDITSFNKSSMLNLMGLWEIFTIAIESLFLPFCYICYKRCCSDALWKWACFRLRLVWLADSLQPLVCWRSASDFQPQACWFLCWVVGGGPAHICSVWDSPKGSLCPGAPERRTCYVICLPACQLLCPILLPTPPFLIDVIPQ